MLIRWKDFFHDHGIRFVETGPNVAKGNIYIQCPWCGSADHSEHMGVRENGLYGCWRDDSHRGGNPAWLIAELLSVGYTEALRVLSSYGDGPALPTSPDKGFRDIVKEKLEQKPENPIKLNKIALPHLYLPSDWMLVRSYNPLTRFAFNYLKSRGFSEPFIDAMELYATQVGEYAYRVMFPVYEDGKLVSWTGRATSGSMGLRYKSLAALPEDQGGWQIKDFIWGYDDAVKLDRGPILVHEGPMDALKSKQWLIRRGSAVALFNASLSNRQMNLLIKLAASGRKLIACFDPDAMSKTLKLWQSLRSFAEVEAVYLGGEDDPGALSEAGFAQSFSKFLS